jgi:hypothetical protein
VGFCAICVATLGPGLLVVLSLLAWKLITIQPHLILPTERCIMRKIHHISALCGSQVMHVQISFVCVGVCLFIYVYIRLTERSSVYLR